MKNYAQIVDQVKPLIRKVGHFILKERLSFNQERVEIKGRNDLVSYVDKTAEEMLVEGLKIVLPNAGFITEEATIQQRRGEYTWIIDPLDGTTNFVHGIPIFSISIGLLHQEELVGGLIYEINRDEIFWAVLNEGAWLNDQRICIASPSFLKESLISTGFPVQNFDFLDAYLKVISKIVQNSHGIRRGGSAATDLAYVACGRYDAFFEYNLNPWDVAAGILLVKEAGGLVTDFVGKDNALFGRQILAAGKIHQELLDLIRLHWPD
jgi:myo-inositol-1(or 4)-monophosphatase